MNQPKLFMLLIGAKPPGRHTEQHDVFFSIGYSMRDLLPQLEAFWPEAKQSLHLDAWREVTRVNGHCITVKEQAYDEPSNGLFFINLGGYKPNEFEEFHYKMLVVAPDKGEAIRQAKQTAFFRHTGFKNATAHVDDKYGIDVDDFYAIADILPASVKSRFRLVIQPAKAEQAEDTLHLGYFKLDKIDMWGL